MRNFTVALAALLYVVVCISCGGGAPDTALNPEIGQPQTQQLNWPVATDPPAVAALPRITSAASEEFILDSPISASPGYHAALNGGVLTASLTLEGEAAMAWVTFQVSGYSAENPPQVLRLYDLWTTCGQIWVGFADFDRGVWRWVPADKDPDWPFSGSVLYDGQNLVHVPEGGSYYRADDGAAFVTILLAEIEPGDTAEYLSFPSARLASGTGVFYEDNYANSDAQPLTALTGYSAVDGDLTVDCTGLPDLNPLRNLVLVTGNLTISNCGPQHLASLGELLEVGGWLVLTPTEPGMDLGLADLRTLGSLKCEINVPINILSFPQMTDCENLNVTCTSTLNEVTFPVLTAVTDQFTLSGSATGAGTGVTSLKLPKLASAGYFGIKSMPVSSLHLANLQELESLSLNNLPVLSQVSCSQLLRVSHLSIEKTPFLSSFNISNAYKFEPDSEGETSLLLRDIDNLETLLWFGSDRIGQVLTEAKISECDNLESLYTGDCFSEIGELELSALPALSYSHGFDGISISQGLFIADTAMESLPYFSGVPDEVQGYVILKDNPDLTDISGLSGITKAASLWLINNDSLTDLSCFANLAECGLSLIIEQNDFLSNLDAFSNLRHFTSDNHWDFPTAIVLHSNTSLSDISGLSGLLPDTGTGLVIDALQIVNNGLDNGDQTAWDLVDAWGGREMVGYELVISGNGWPTP